MPCEEWGPWIRHDGAPVVGVLRVGDRVRYTARGPGLVPSSEEIPIDWPGFHWRWKRVRRGWFRTELRPVCDDPDYAPIIRYRIRKPRGMAILERIVAQPAERVDA